MGIRLLDNLFSIIHTTNALGTGKSTRVNAVYKKINVRTVFSEDDRVLYEENGEEKNNELKPIDAIREDIVNFACQYEGQTASEMKKIITAAGCSFNSSWCADFVKYVLKTKLGDNMPEWCNSSRCEDIKTEGDKHAVRLEDNLAEAKRGDIVLFSWNGNDHASHVGFIYDVITDEFGNVIAVITFEGNSSGMCEKRTYTYDENAGTYSSIKSIIRVYSLEQKKDDDEKETHENDTHKSFIQRIRSLFQFQDLIS